MTDKLPSILLGCDFYSKPRNRKWIADNGAEAVLILQTVWIASSQERNCKIRKDEVTAIPYPFPIGEEELISILESAVAVGLLDSDGSHYFNSQIVKDHKSFEVKRQNYRKGREKRDAKLAESSEDSGRIQGETSHNHIECESEYESEREPEKQSVIFSEVVIPANFKHAETVEAVTRWATHVRDRFKKRFDDSHFQALLASYASKPSELIPDINLSISNDWRKICHDAPTAKEAPVTTQGRPQPKAFEPIKFDPNNKPITGDPRKLLTPQQKALLENLDKKTKEVPVDA